MTPIIIAAAALLWALAVLALAAAAYVIMRLITDY